jgi:cell division septal protein FtsQ
MWFKRKNKNRRLGRAHVLDVKLRSSQVRSARARMAAAALAIVFGIVAGLFLLWRGGGWTLDQLVYKNPSFAIKDLDVRTDGVLALEQLRRWAGVRVGNNLLDLDLARVKRDLELVPVVQSASVERILPHTLRIRVTEREPIARLQVARMHPEAGVDFAEFLVDTEGFVLPPSDARLLSPGTTPPNDQALPLIAGLSGNEVQTGRRLENPQALGAVRLVLAFEHSPMAGLVDLKSIHVGTPEVLVVTTGQGTEATLSLKDPAHQLRRWREIFDRGARANLSIAAIDLAVSNNIPVRLVESAVAAPASTPKLPKPTRTRKRNV